VDISWHSRGILVARPYVAGSRNSRSVRAKCIRLIPSVDSADKNPTKSPLHRNDFVFVRKYSTCGDSCMSMRMRNSRATLARIVLISTVLVVAWAALLAIPQPLFRFSVRAENLVLHSDRPFSKAAGKRVLEMAEEKLSRSPIYSGRQDYHVFICNSRWRQMLFFNKDYGAGGVAQYPVTAQVFLREARVEDNRLISPGGKSRDGAIAL